MLVSSQIGRFAGVGRQVLVVYRIASSNRNEDSTGVSKQTAEMAMDVQCGGCGLDIDLLHRQRRRCRSQLLLNWSQGTRGAWNHVCTRRREILIPDVSTQQLHVTASTINITPTVYKLTSNLSNVLEHRIHLLYEHQSQPRRVLTRGPFAVPEYSLLQPAPHALPTDWLFRRSHRTMAG